MYLNEAQIKSALTGALEIPHDGQGLIPLRYSAPQREALQAVPHLADRGCEGAGVTLDLSTDARAIRLDLDGWREAEDGIFCFDVLENGVLTQSFQASLPVEKGSHLVPAERQMLAFPLSDGEKRVTVVFPWILVARIRSVELVEASFFRPWEHKRTWLAFGDSITQGAFSAHSSMTYVCQLARLLDARLVNQGIGGDTFHRKNLAPGTYPGFDLVTVAYGTNDYTHATAEAFDAEMPEFLRRVAEEFREVPVFVILPLWRLSEATGKLWQMGRTLPQVRDMIRGEAEKYPNFHIVDGSRTVPHLQDFYADKSMLHPNDLGFSQMALNLYQEITRVIGEV